MDSFTYYLYTLHNITYILPIICTHYTTLCTHYLLSAHITQHYARITYYLHTLHNTMHTLSNIWGLTFLHGEDPADTVAADPGQWLGEVVVGALSREICVRGALQG